MEVKVPLDDREIRQRRRNAKKGVDSGVACTRLVVDVDQVEEVMPHSVMPHAENEDVRIEPRVNIREELEFRRKAFVDVDSDLGRRVRRKFVDALPLSMNDWADKVVTSLQRGAGDFSNEVNRIFLNK